jgi:anti-sigma regulatory factor (Ser/Thr protein kinase)
MMIAAGPHTRTMTARHTFPGVPASIAKARVWARDTLTDDGMGVPEDLTLVLTELATNTIQHTRSGLDGGTFAVRLVVHPDRVRVEVRDNGPRGHRLPTRRDATLSAERGRGLAIVDAFATTWGVLPTGSGVYAEVPR